MSFDMFIIAIREDRDDSFPRALVEDAFRAYVCDLSGEYWNLQDADGGKRFVNISVDNSERIKDFCVNRPPDFETFPQFWQALFEILRGTNTALFWPGDPPHPMWCVANPEFAKELPEKFIESWGRPAFVSSAIEIIDALERTNRHFR